MLRPSHAAAAIATAGCLLLTSACGGNPEPEPLPNSQRSPLASPSPSPSATPPVMPAAAKEKTDAAIESFARHYVDLVNYATRTGDTGALASAAKPSCATCNRLSKRIKTLYTRGGSIRSKGWKVTGVEVVPKQPLARKYVDVAITQTPQEVREKRGADVTSYPGGKQALTMLLARTDDSWIVSKLSLAGQQ